MTEKEFIDLQEVLVQKRNRQLKTPHDLFLNDYGEPIKCEFCGVEFTTANFDELRSIDPRILAIITKNGFDKTNPQPATVPGCAKNDFWKDNSPTIDRPNHQVCISCYKKSETYLFS
jgi:hypothetical protein